MRLTSVSEKDTLERESRKLGSITPPQTYNLMYVVGWDGGKIKMKKESESKGTKGQVFYNL